MTDRFLFDPVKAAGPLLILMPESLLVSTCYRCGQKIDGVVMVTERGFVEHPDACPPLAESAVPEGMLL